MQPRSHEDDYRARVLDIAFDVIRARLLLHRPLDVVDYICQFQAQIKSEINAAVLARPAAAAAAAHPAPSLAPAHTAPAAPTCGGKFDTFVMPSGNIEDFHKGLSSRIGFPHLQFFKTMEAEHCSMAGCDMSFTTRNYGITTTASAEWSHERTGATA